MNSPQEENKNEGSGQEAKPKRQFYINIMGAIREFPGGRFYNPRVDGDLEGAEIVNPCTGKVEYIWNNSTPEESAKFDARAEAKKNEDGMQSLDKVMRLMDAAADLKMEMQKGENLPEFLVRVGQEYTEKYGGIMGAELLSGKSSKDFGKEEKELAVTLHLYHQNKKDESK